MNDCCGWLQKKVKKEGATEVSSDAARLALLHNKRKTSADLITLAWWGCLSSIYLWNLFPGTTASYPWSTYMIPDIWPFFMGSLVLSNIFCGVLMKYIAGVVDRMDGEIQRQTLRVDGIVKLAVKKEGVYGEDGVSKSCTPLSPFSTVPAHARQC